jgi:CRISPR/Cas system-associated exonuclease Cas4 (RecB family)
MPAGWSYDTLLSSGTKESKRRIINTSSDIAQVKLLNRLLQNIGDTGSENAHQTAVVLADENLLVPALSSIPEGVNDINITMGYPLRQTSVYLLVRQLLDLQMNARTENEITRFSHREVLKILKNGVIVRLNNGAGSELLEEINEKNLLWIPSDRFTGSQVLSAVFRKADSPADLSGYLREILAMVLSVAENPDGDTGSISLQRNVRNEFIYRIILSLNRLDEIVNSPDIRLSVQTWARILDRLLRNQTVPFSGEPLSGIQIMGILETRTLDFKNLIILSVNEGVLPSVTAASSFVPFALREAFGMPSLNHQESIYAYHFYRLLHRAENVTFVYNSDSEGLRSGEMSRFLQQMKYDNKLAPEVITVSFEIQNPASVSDTLPHTEEHNQRLISRFTEKVKGTGRYISPSAINTWLNCRMKFYYRYVCGLEERERVTEEIDHAKVGTLLHSTIRSLYSDYIGKVLDSDTIERLSKNRELISSLISNNIIQQFGRDNHSIDKGNEFIIRNVVYVFINRILQTDKTAAPFRIISFEDLYMFPLTIKNNLGDLKLFIGGRIDRVDEKNGVVRIIDYKTGDVSDSINSLSDLFGDDRNKKDDAWLQTLVYCEMYLANKNDLKIMPSVYKLKRNPGPEDSEKLKISKTLTVKDYNDIRKEFLEYLNTTVRNIFNPDEPFTMTTDLWNKCSFCPYRKLCLR